MKTCVCNDCLQPSYKLRFCRRHYRIWLAAGIPVKERENMTFDDMMDRVREKAA